MRRTTRTLTSRLISCIILAGLLIAYYLPYYPSLAERWGMIDDNESIPSLTLLLGEGVSYRLIRPTSRFLLCHAEDCADTETLISLFSGGYIRHSGLQRDSLLFLSLTGYGEIIFSALSFSGQQGRYMSMSSTVWSGKVFVPGVITTGDGVLSLLSSGYIDTRRLGRSASFFDNPYQRVIIDRRFISQ